jgi:hypothetical protein
VWRGPATVWVEKSKEVLEATREELALTEEVKDKVMDPQV